MASVGAFLVSPFIQFLDEFGNPLSAGLLTIFLSGTNTLQNVYSNPDCAAGHEIPQPIQLDSAGRMAGWTLPVALTVVVKKADGTTWWQQDHYLLPTPTTATTLTLPDWLTAILFG